MNIAILLEKTENAIKDESDVLNCMDEALVYGCDTIPLLLSIITVIPSCIAGRLISFSFSVGVQSHFSDIESRAWPGCSLQGGCQVLSSSKF
jgi:hypothetical protein